MHFRFVPNGGSRTTIGQIPIIVRGSTIYICLENDRKSTNELFGFPPENLRRKAFVMVDRARPIELLWHATVTC